MGTANVTAIAFLMAVLHQHQTATPVVEKHPVTVVRRRDGLFLLHPRAVEGAAEAVGHALGVLLAHPTCPEAAKATRLSAEEPGAVGHGIEGGAFVVATPGAVTGAEHHLFPTDGAGEVVGEAYLLNSTIAVLQPFVAIDHIGMAVCVVPEGGIERRLMRWQIGGIGHGTVGAVGAVADEHVTGATRDMAPVQGVDADGVVGEGGEVVVLFPILMRTW